MDYHMLRYFADSWALALMTVFFIAVVIFVFRPGSRQIYNEAANIPFADPSED